MNLDDDKALLKIINKNGVFYLESAAYQHHADDLAKQQSTTQSLDDSMNGQVQQ